MIIVASLSLMGYEHGITRFIAFYTGQGEDGKIRASIVAVLWFLIPSGCLTGSLVYFFAQDISTLIFHNRGLIPALRVFAFAIPFFALAQVFNAGLRGLKKIHLMIITDKIIWRIFPLIFFLLQFFLFEFRIIGAAFSFLFTVIIMCIISSIFLFKQITRSPNSEDKKKCFQEISKFSWPMALANLNNNLKSRTDIFLLGFFLGAFEVGIFSVASTLSSLLNLFLGSVIIIFNPLATELYSNKNTPEIARLFSLVTKWLFLLVFPLLLFLVFFPKPSISILFGDAYVNAAPVLIILTICCFFNTIVGPTGATILALGYSKTLMKINIGSTIINIALNLLLIPRYGVIGAGLASGLATVFQQIGMLFVVKKHIRLHLFKITILLYALYCIVLIFCFKIFLENYLKNIMGLSVISIIFYFSALSGIIITKQLEDDDLILIRKIRINLRLRCSFLKNKCDNGKSN